MKTDGGFAGLCLMFPQLFLLRICATNEIYYFRFYFFCFFPLCSLKTYRKSSTVVWNRKYKTSLSSLSVWLMFVIWLRLELAPKKFPKMACENKTTTRLEWSFCFLAARSNKTSNRARALHNNTREAENKSRARRRKRNCTLIYDCESFYLLFLISFMFMHFHALLRDRRSFPWNWTMQKFALFFAYILFTRRRTIDPNYCCRKLNWAGESEREREFILFEIYRPTQELKCDAINSFLNSNYWHQILARISSRQCRDSERERES